MDFKKLISDVNNWNDLDNKIKSLTNTTEMGDAFELLTKHYFQIDPKLKVKFQEVWLQNEIPQKVRRKLKLPNKDLGFDLLVESDNQFFPVQCKYHSDFKRNITFQEVSTFLTLYESNSKLSKAFITSTAGDVSNNYKKVVNKPVQLILNDTWQSLDKSFFNQLRNKLNNKTYSPEAYSPRKHQQKALKDSKEYFINNNNSKGKLIFPCGAGKSLTGFWMSQELGSQTTLIAVPSLSLIKQTLDVYLKEFVARDIKVKFLCICSDEGIGKNDDIAFKTENIGVPCDTDPVFIKQWLKDNRKENIVVFTTYQSGRIIAELSKDLKLTFEVGIFDEAHKTVGSSKKLFSHLLFDDNISVQKRIYMTATERFYSGSKDDMISMDDEDIYGETFSFMSFKDAINEELLTDYKIITIDVKKSEIAEFIKTNGLIQLSDKWKKETEARSLSSMIALRKAMNRFDIKNVVSFHSSIERAKRNMGIHSYITSTYGYKPIETFTVSGKDSTSKRSQIVKEFAESDRALITNARCLTEGVDVPNIDCIVFADPRKSKVDIVQALGRALRKKDGKDWGYVILPVVYDEKTNEIDNDSFNEILSIIRGLASNDERIIEYFKDKNQPNSNNRIEGSDIFQIDSELLCEKDLIENLEIKLWENLSRFEWLSFDEAKSFVKTLALKSENEWREYCKSGKRPSNIPSNAYKVYENEWRGIRDFLGYGYFTYKEASEYVQSLGIQTASQWRKYWKIHKRPTNLPAAPYSKYTEWTSWGDFLGTGRIADGKQNWISFDEARQFALSLNFKSNKQWRLFSKEKSMPKNIPKNPEQTYKKEWKGWGYFLGNKNEFRGNWITYYEAKKNIKKFNLTSGSQWYEFAKSDLKPKNIPTDVKKVYSSDWVSWQDFLGTGKIEVQKGNWMSFEEAREYVQNLGLKSGKEWNEYCKSGKKPANIPVGLTRVYKEKWISMPDFLGTKKGFNSDFLSFIDARKFVHSLGLKSTTEWQKYCKSGKKPHNIPSSPRNKYKNEFISMGDWLNTGTVASQKITFLNFEEARKITRNLGLKTMREWKKYRNRPSNIPYKPDYKYKDKGWKGWKDFLGND